MWGKGRAGVEPTKLTPPYRIYHTDSPDRPWGGSANIAAGPLELPDLAMDATGTPKVAKRQVKRNENEESAFRDLFKIRAATESTFKTWSLD